MDVLHNKRKRERGSDGTFAGAHHAKYGGREKHMRQVVEGHLGIKMAFCRHVKSKKVDTCPVKFQREVIQQCK